MEDGGWNAEGKDFIIGFSPFTVNIGLKNIIFQGIEMIVEVSVPECSGSSERWKARLESRVEEG